jgi:S1-C subfamily serine protease/pSer/pThr/pTyr-binding forkhead associated (FHA) protein
MTIRLTLPTSDSVDVDRTLIVGRLPECDVVIADVLVSGNHFEIGPAPGGAQIVDLQSSNGTFVNGERLVAPRVLTGGEEIAVGSQKIMVERVVQVAPADLRLVVRVGIDTGTATRITDSAPIVIGRSDDADLKLTDPLVSARHCQVALVRPPAGPCPHCGMLAQPGDAHCVGCGRARIAAEVEDLGSANGVLVDGTPVNPHARADLLEGGELQLGDTIIVFGSESDPVNLGPAPTVIRSIPKNLDAPATPTAPPAIPTAPRRRISPLAWIVGGIAIIAVAIVIVVALTSSDSAPPQVTQATEPQHDAAWVVAQQALTTVQVFSCDYETETRCDDTWGSGSGSVIDLGASLVLTNFHVIANAAATQPLANLSVGISITGEKIKVAEVVGFSACDDLALIKVTEDVSSFQLKQVSFADPASIAVGESVVVLGYPGTISTSRSGDAQQQLTTGSVSALNVKLENYIDLIQTDAPINHGNSGGPMFDLDGNQIGVASLGEGNNTQGIHYAISVAQILKVLPKMKAGTKQTGLSNCAT